MSELTKEAMEGFRKDDAEAAKKKKAEDFAATTDKLHNAAFMSSMSVLGDLGTIGLSTTGDKRKRTDSATAIKKLGLDFMKAVMAYGGLAEHMLQFKEPDKDEKPGLEPANTTNGSGASASGGGSGQTGRRGGFAGLGNESAAAGPSFL